MIVALLVSWWLWKVGVLSAELALQSPAAALALTLWVLCDAGNWLNVADPFSPHPAALSAESNPTSSLLLPLL